MVVNSLSFLLFFTLVFAVYYIPVGKNSPKFQNLWLLLASYFFYGFADWRLILLLLGTTAVFYGIGLWLSAEMKRQNKRKKQVKKPTLQQAWNRHRNRGGTRLYIIY